MILQVFIRGSEKVLNTAIFFCTPRLFPQRKFDAQALDSFYTGLSPDVFRHFFLLGCWGWSPKASPQKATKSPEALGRWTKSRLDAKGGETVCDTRSPMRSGSPSAEQAAESSKRRLDAKACTAACAKMADRRETEAATVACFKEGLVIEDGHSSPFRLTTAHYLHHALYNWSRGYRAIFRPSSPGGPPLTLMTSSKGVKPLSSVLPKYCTCSPIPLRSALPVLSDPPSLQNWNG